MLKDYAQVAERSNAADCKPAYHRRFKSYPVLQVLLSVLDVWKQEPRNSCELGLISLVADK